jgi:hypothetical protein
MFSKPQMAICLLLGAWVLSAFANTGQQAAKKTGRIIVTGCLQKGVVLDRFNLIGQDGKAYALRSSSVRLADHVGHTVTINGELKRDQKRDDYDFEGSEVNEEYGKEKKNFVDVQVTSLKVLDVSCKQDKSGGNSPQ